MTVGLITTVIASIPVIVTVPVAEFSIHHFDFPLTLFLQKTDLSLFFPTAHKEIVSYRLDPVIILPVDAGDLHIPFSFIGKTTVAKTGVVVEGKIEVNKTPVIIIPVVLIPLIVVLIPLIGRLIVPSVSLPVIPGARLSLCQCKQIGRAHV